MSQLIILICLWNFPVQYKIKLFAVELYNSSSLLVLYKLQFLSS